eukprot:1758094-Amphidinium_carterae.2
MPRTCAFKGGDKCHRLPGVSRLVPESMKRRCPSLAMFTRRWVVPHPKNLQEDRYRNCMVRLTQWSSTALYIAHNSSKQIYVFAG